MNVRPLFILSFLVFTCGIGSPSADAQEPAPPSGTSQEAQFTFKGVTWNTKSFLQPKSWPIVSPVDKSLFWIESTMTGVALNNFSFDGQTWAESSRRSVLDFGKRSLFSSLFDAVHNRAYAISDDRLNEAYNVYEIDPVGGSMRQVTNVGYAPAASLRPELSLMALVGRPDKTAEKTCLYVVDLSVADAHEKAEYCDPDGFNSWMFDAPQISEDGREIAFEQLKDKGPTGRSLVIFNRDTKQTRTLADMSADYGQVLGWSHGRIFFLDNAGTNQLGLYSIAADGSERRLLYKAKQASLAGAYDVESDLLILLDGAGGPGADLVALTASDGHELARTNSGPLSLFWFGNPTMPLGDGRFAFPTVSATSGAIDMALWNPLAPAPAVTIAFHPASNDIQICDAEEITYPTFDVDPATGQTRLIDAIHVRPTNDTQLDKPAGVVFAHGGPADRSTLASVNSFEIQTLCHMGFHVIAANPRGSEGQGAEFESLNHQDWGGGDLQDYEYARRYLQNVLGIDSARIGIIGESYGGYITNMAVTQADNKFAFGIDVYGLADLLYDAANSGISNTIVGAMGDPVQNAALYHARSPIDRAANMRVPLMIVQGDRDTRTPVVDSRNFANALRSLGKDVTYVELPGEGHDFRFVDTITAYLRQQAQFLERLVSE